MIITPPIVTTAEAAELLGVTERRVRQMAKDGTLTPIEIKMRNEKGRPPLLFKLADVAELEHRRRKDGGRIARLAENWRIGMLDGRTRGFL